MGPPARTMMRNPNRHACRGWRDVTSGERESRVSNAADLTDITDLVNRHVNDIDAKRWDRVGDFFSDDAVAQWTPEKSMQGPAGIVGAMRQMLDTDEVVTYHDVGNF